MTRTIGRLKLSSLCGENRSDSGPNRSPIPVEIDRSPSGAKRRGTNPPACETFLLFCSRGTNAGEQEVVHERFASPVESARLPSGPSRSTGPALRAAASMTRTNREAEQLSSLCGENRRLDPVQHRSPFFPARRPITGAQTDHRFRSKSIAPPSETWSARGPRKPNFAGSGCSVAAKHNRLARPVRLRGSQIAAAFFEIRRGRKGRSKLAELWHPAESANP